MQIINVEQGTDEWFKIREFKLTGSHAQEIGNYGKGLDTYCLKLASEHYSTAKKEHFTSKDTERGNELEPIARSLYELEKGVDVTQVGFITIDALPFVGCSPDGLVEEDGLIEIKCPDDLNHFRMIINGEKEIESKYLWQVQMNLLLTGRKWADLIFYNPNFKENMIIYRILPDKEKHEELNKGIEKGTKILQEYKNKYENN